MPDYWITTHWPTPATEPGQSRHVFVKAHNVTLPRPGDFIFFRESMYATVKGKSVRTVTRHHRGKQAQFDLPRGSGGIIGTATVDGTIRKQVPDDVVFDFGDLRDWSVIPCRDFQAASVSLENLLALLGKDNPRFLSLWRMPDDLLASKLLKALRR
jgi:hypothetical protein